MGPSRGPQLQQLGREGLFRGDGHLPLLDADGLTGPNSIWIVLLLLLQFPVYAVVLREAWGGSGFRSRLACVVLLHALAVATCFAIQARIENRELRGVIDAQNGLCETMICQ